MKPKTARILLGTALGAAVAAVPVVVLNDQAERDLPGASPSGARAIATVLARRTAASDPGETLSPGEAAAFDASLYAKDFGLTQTEAERRLPLQDQMWPFARRIEEVAPRRLAGRWIYHTSGFGLVVWFTGEPEPELEARMIAIAREAPAPVEIRWGATYPLDFLRAAGQEYSSALWKYDGVAGLGTDVYTNTIQVSLSRDSGWAEKPDELAAVLAKRFGVPFTVVVY